jgi:hypothetical protein
MTPDTLFAGSSEPAHLPGYGPIPAAIARTLVRDADRAWIRRLFTTPNSRDLVALDSTRRFFNGGLRRLLVLRDQTCRTPWCDAPITAADHTHPAHHGGATSAANGTGLCQRCNNTKETPGWHTRVISTGLPRNDLHDPIGTGDDLHDARGTGDELHDTRSRLAHRSPATHHPNNHPHRQDLPLHRPTHGNTRADRSPATHHP